MLFLSLEEGARLMKRKLQRAALDPVALARVTFMWEWKRGRDGALDLLRYLDAHPATRYVIVDSLTRFRSIPDQRTPPFVADYEAINELHQITNARPGLAIDVCHHTRKLVSVDPLDDISGTYGVSAACDAYCVMRANGDNAVLHIGGRLWDREISQFDVHRNGTHRWALGGEHTGLTDTHRDTLDALRRSGGQGPTDCAKFWGIGKTTAQDRLETLVNHGVAYKKAGVFYAR